MEHGDFRHDLPLHLQREGEAAQLRHPDFDVQHDGPHPQEGVGEQAGHGLDSGAGVGAVGSRRGT